MQESVSGHPEGRHAAQGAGRRHAQGMSNTPPHTDIHAYNLPVISLTRPHPRFTQSAPAVLMGMAAGLNSALYARKQVLQGSDSEDSDSDDDSEWDDD